MYRFLFFKVVWDTWRLKYVTLKILSLLQKLQILRYLTKNVFLNSYYDKIKKKNWSGLILIWRFIILSCVFRCQDSEKIKKKNVKKVKFMLVCKEITPCIIWGPMPPKVRIIFATILNWKDCSLRPFPRQSLIMWNIYKLTMFWTMCYMLFRYTFDY